MSTTSITLTKATIDWYNEVVKYEIVTLQIFSSIYI